MIGYYNLSVVLTYFGLCTAVFGMTMALTGEVTTALLCLMVCGMCDMFDGTIARKCKRTDDEKSFGIQIDSLCDLVCFGVFPAMLGYGIKNIEVNFFDIIASAIFVLAAIIRLGYFNVQEIKLTSQSDCKREYYEGLPVTSVSILLPLFFLMDIYIEPLVSIKVYSVALILIAFAFVSKVKIKKPYMHSLILVAFLGLFVFFLILKEGDNIANASSIISYILWPIFA